jgi:hypothetical protein
MNHVMTEEYRRAVRLILTMVKQYHLSVQNEMTALWTLRVNGVLAAARYVRRVAQFKVMEAKE